MRELARLVILTAFFSITPIGVPAFAELACVEGIPMDVRLGSVSAPQTADQILMNEFDNANHTWVEHFIKDAVCTTRFPRAPLSCPVIHRPMSFSEAQKIIDAKIKTYPRSKSEKKYFRNCLHFVRELLKKTYGEDLFLPPLPPPSNAARDEGIELTHHGFKQVYPPSPTDRAEVFRLRLTHAKPQPGNKIEVRVYKGGSTFLCGGGEPSGHVEICFLKKCISDYRSEVPLDKAQSVFEDAFGAPKGKITRKVEEPYTLTGIYVMEPESKDYHELH